MSAKPDVTGIYDSRTGSIQYVVACPETRKCAIIDPVLDFDEKSASTATLNADKILALVAEHRYEVEWILDTHPHADHFSAASYLKEKTGAPIAIGEKVRDVQKLWNGFYNRPNAPADGSQWDRLFADGDEFSVGNIPARVMFSPGHTLASITYVIGDAAFVHDTLFMPDSGTARADFPGGCARQLWTSVPCRTRRASSPAMTISPTGASRAGNRRWPSRRRRTFTFRSTKPRRPMSPRARHATGPCRCRSSSSTRCRSTPMPAACRSRKTMACVTLKCR
jgi:glyoxylase-like metal-dependent hydrolase (beta-lactamase superfamily II)